MCIQKIHITGASGSGTTTLGKALSGKYGFVQLDSDNYFWLPTDPPYQQVREVKARKNLLQADMMKEEKWVSSGSLCSWGDFALDYFDLVIFLIVPSETRIQRLYEREHIRSPESFRDGSLRSKQFKEFIDWAKKYDNGGAEVRSLNVHQKWLNRLNCPILKIEGEVSVDESVTNVENYMKTL